MLKQVFKMANRILDRIDISPGPLWYFATAIGLVLWLTWSGWPLLLWFIFTYIVDLLLWPAAVKHLAKTQQKIAYGRVNIDKKQA
jgi:hypothetical protein